MNNLEDNRLARAKEAIENDYDFDGEIVEGYNWNTFTTGEDELSAQVFFADPSGGDSFLGSAVVHFEAESDEITSVNAYLGGNELGFYNTPAKPGASM